MLRIQSVIRNDHVSANDFIRGLVRVSDHRLYNLRIAFSSF